MKTTILILASGFVYLFIAHLVAAFSVKKGIDYWKTLWIAVLISPLAGILFTIIVLMPSKKEMQTENTNPLPIQKIKYHD